MILNFQQCNSIIVAGLVDIENTSTNHSILEDTLSKSGSSHPLLMSMNSATLRKSHQMFNISLLGGAPQNQALTETQVLDSFLFPAPRRSVHNGHSITNRFRPYHLFDHITPSTISHLRPHHQFDHITCCPHHQYYLFYQFEHITPLPTPPVRPHNHIIDIDSLRNILQTYVAQSQPPDIKHFNHFRILKTRYPETVKALFIRNLTLRRSPLSDLLQSSFRSSFHASLSASLPPTTPSKWPGKVNRLLMSVLCISGY